MPNNYYAICSDGDHYVGQEANSEENALFSIVPDGGGPEPTNDPARDAHGWWYKDMIEIYQITNPALRNVLEEEQITSLICEGEGDFTSGVDFVLTGRYRWKHDPLEAAVG